MSTSAGDKDKGKSKGKDKAIDAEVAPATNSLVLSKAPAVQLNEIVVMAMLKCISQSGYQYMPEVAGWGKKDSYGLLLRAELRRVPALKHIQVDKTLDIYTKSIQTVIIGASALDVALESRETTVIAISELIHMVGSDEGTDKRLTPPLWECVDARSELFDARNKEKDDAAKATKSASELAKRSKSSKGGSSGSKTPKRQHRGSKKSRIDDDDVEDEDEDDDDDDDEEEEGAQRKRKRGKKAKPSSFKDELLATLKDDPLELERAKQETMKLEIQLLQLKNAQNNNN